MRARPDRLDLVVAALLFLVAFSVYWQTLAPTVAFLFDDSLEFQLLGWRAAIAHPTGYPLYSLLLTLAARLPPGDAAWRSNLLSALAGAAAVALVYGAGRKLAGSRQAAVAAAFVFAFGPVFWSQTRVAEVYTLQAALTAAILLTALNLRSRPEAVTAASRRLVLLAFVVGLALAHHRMTVLLLPALGVYLWLVRRSLPRDLKTAFLAAGALLAPLLLYFYLALRGLVTGSLDATFQNSPSGLWEWVTGSSYAVYLTGNPLNQLRQAGEPWQLLVSNLTPVGLALAAWGVIVQLKSGPREWAFLVISLVFSFGFAVLYRVADVEVFFIPSLLLLALFIAAGTASLLRIGPRGRIGAAWGALATVVLLGLPLTLFETNFAALSLAGKYDVYDYGVDLLSQPLPSQSTVVGILGEMTLLRYLQETEGRRPDLETVAADREPARLAAVERALRRPSPVFLTRKLPGLEQKYSLSSLGSLIQVETQPGNPPTPGFSPVDQGMDGVRLAGYRAEKSGPANRAGRGPAKAEERVTLYWKVERKIPNDRAISLKLLSSAGERGGQLDRRPVLDAYPTTAWWAGEWISDTYDIPFFPGARPGLYRVHLSLYDAGSGEVYGERDLFEHHYDAAPHGLPDSELEIDSPAHVDFGEVKLEGFTLDASDPFGPGDEIPVTLLWTEGTPSGKRGFSLELRGERGAVQSRAITAGREGTVTGDYVRQEVSLRLPAALANGEYELWLRVGSPPPLRFPWMSSEVELGRIKVMP